MLFRKMMRDMKGNFTQFLSIFLMAFLGVFIYAGVGGEWIGLLHTSESYYEDTNFADMWIYGEDFEEADERAAAEVDGVVSIQRRLMIPAAADLEKSPSVTLYFMEEEVVSRSYLVSGEPFTPDKDGLWLDARFAEARDLQVGDMLKLQYESLTLEKEILGTIYSPDYVYMGEGDSMLVDFYANGFAYLGKEAFPLPDYFFYNQIVLTAEEEKLEQVESQLEKVLDGSYSVLLTRENFESYRMFEDEVQQHKSMGLIFPMVFFGVALLTMVTTMTRLVNNQRIQIGTLKALGFQKRAILLHYVSYGFWMSLLGSLLGALLGPLALPPLFYPSMKSFYTMPEWKTAYHYSFYLVALLTVAACTLVTYLACNKMLRENPARTLRPKAPKSARHGVVDRLPFWNKLSFSFQWNYRDIMRNRARSFMAVFGVLGCTALLVCAFGMNDGMNDIKEWQYQDINQYKSLLKLEDEADDSQIRSIIDAVDGEAIMESAAEIEYDGSKKTGILTVTDEVTLMRHTDKNRNFIELPEEGIAISYKLAQQLGIKEGDIVRWHPYGDQEWSKGEITSIYRTPTAQGIILSRAYFEKLDYEFRATSVLSAQTGLGSYEGVTSIVTDEELTSSWEDFTEAMVLMVAILIIAAIILAVVVLYNLGILSFMEMEREIATLKVVGFQSSKLQGLLLVQNLILSLVGFMVGIPLGKFLIETIVSLTGDTMDMYIQIHLTNIGLSFALAFVLCLLVNAMFRKRINRLHMVEALKGVE